MKHISLERACTHDCYGTNFVIIGQRTKKLRRAMNSTNTNPTVTVTTLPSNTTVNGSVGDKDDSDGNAVIIACVIIAVVIIAAAIIAFVLLRKKRMSQMMDTEKKNQIQMSSARNAGVYQDLTVSVNPDEKPPASPEHERLKAAEEA